MDIDLSSLDFKILQPSKLPLDDTRAEEEETINAFRKTSKLFKNSRKNAQSSYRILPSYQTYSKAPSSASIPVFKQIYSLENFESFQDSKKIFSAVENSKSQLYHQFNKTQVSDHGSQISSIESSDEISFLMDDLRVEAESQAKNKLKEAEEKENKQKKQKIFFLTAQDESQSSIKQFYFNLKEENDVLKCSDVLNTREQEINVKANERVNNKKREIKKIIFKFIDDLEIMDQNEIDPQFSKRLSELLPEIKIPSALNHQYSGKENQFSRQKWNVKKTTPQTQQKSLNKQNTEQNRIGETKTKHKTQALQKWRNNR